MIRYTISRDFSSFKAGHEAVAWTFSTTPYSNIVNSLVIGVHVLNSLGSSDGFLQFSHNRVVAK